jgi:hypothetical protein
LVCDFEPGTSTVPVTGWETAGAGQGTDPGAGGRGVCWGVTGLATYS